MQIKLGRLEGDSRPPHLIVVSGSNALYSVNSPALSETVGMPVTNAAMQWSYTYHMLERVAERTIPGDIVLLPLEYQYYTTIAERPMLEACYLLSQSREHIGGLIDWVEVLGQCNPSIILEGLGIKTLKTLGATFPRAEDESPRLMTPEGDIRENLPAKANPQPPTRDPLINIDDPKWKGPRRILKVVEKLTAEGVRVFLTFPVSPEKNGDFEVASRAWLEAFDRWANSMGAEVISSPDAHLFPSECFFDSNYHLHQGCTEENARIYGKAILKRMAELRQ